MRSNRLREADRQAGPQTSARYFEPRRTRPRRRRAEALTGELLPTFQQLSQIHLD